MRMCVADGQQEQEDEWRCWSSIFDGALVEGQPMAGVLQQFGEADDVGQGLSCKS